MAITPVKIVVLVIMVTVALVAGQQTGSSDHLNKLPPGSGQVDARNRSRTPNNDRLSLSEVSDLESDNIDMLDERLFRMTIFSRLNEIQRAMSAANDVDGLVEKRVKKDLRMIESQLTCNFTKQLEEIRQDIANLSHTVDSAMASTQLNRTMNFDKCIWGLTSWKSMLYIARWGTTALDVLDDITWIVRGNLSLPGASCINDLATCPTCEFLFAADTCNNDMHVVDEHGVIAHWSTKDKPRGISVNSYMNVIVTYDLARKIREFTRYGEIIREIVLPDDVTHPLHAVETSGGRYYVSHAAVEEPGLHRIIVVNRNGHILEQYGGSSGSGIGQLKTPIRLAVISGHLLAFELANRRILSFNSSPLSYISQLLDLQGNPKRIAVKEDGSQLYVSYNNYNGTTCLSGYVNVYNMMWR